MAIDALHADIIHFQEEKNVFALQVQFKLIGSSEFIVDISNCFMTASICLVTYANHTQLRLMAWRYTYARPTFAIELLDTVRIKLDAHVWFHLQFWKSSP